MNGIKQALHRRLKPRKMRAFYAAFIPDQQLCFDVGASEGKISKTLIDLGHTVVAVEPQQGLVRDMRERFKKEKRFSCDQKLLSNQIGHEAFYICEKPELSTSSTDFRNFISNEHKISYLSSEQVASTTLDHLIKEYGKPYYIKIDVEGSEYKVLEGLGEYVSVVSFEFVRGRLSEARKCLELLSSRSEIRCNLSLFEDYEFYFEDWINLSSLHSFFDRSAGKYSGEIYVRSYSNE